MTGRKCLLALAIVMGVALTGCDNNSVNPPPLTDPDADIEVSIGEYFSITLASNPTTGYDWVFFHPVPAAIARLEYHDYIPDPNPEGMYGKGGKDIWIFQAVGRGYTVISLGYVRLWQPGSVDRRVDIDVNVH